MISSNLWSYLIVITTLVWLLSNVSKLCRPLAPVDLVLCLRLKLCFNRLRLLQQFWLFRISKVGKLAVCLNLLLNALVQAAAARLKVQVRSLKSTDDVGQGVASIAWHASKDCRGLGIHHRNLVLLPCQDTIIVVSILFIINPVVGRRGKLLIFFLLDLLQLIINEAVVLARGPLR